MKDKKTLIFSIIFIGIGIYYLACEFISIIYSDSFIEAYVVNTISDLSNPNSVLHSKMYGLMNSAFIITGPLFLISYIMLFKDKSTSLLPIGIILAILLCIGSIFTGIFHNLDDNTINLHTIGSTMVFVSGNLLLIYTAIAYHEKNTYTTIALILGIVGIINSIAVGVCLLRDFKTLLPLFERMTVYPIIIFEILTGIHFLMKTKNEEYKLA